MGYEKNFKELSFGVSTDYEHNLEELSFGVSILSTYFCNMIFRLLELFYLHLEYFLQLKSKNFSQSCKSLFRNDSAFHTLRIPTVANRQSQVPRLLLLLLSARSPPTSHSTFKDSRGGPWGLQMVVFYGFTLFTNWFLAM